jgi:2-dehydropantoate 2-reductase
LNHEQPARARAHEHAGGVAVLGPGGVGGFLAGALARQAPYRGAVIVVSNEATAELIAREGVRVTSAVLGEFVAHPRALTRLDEPVAVLLVATKATALQASLQRISALPRLVVPVLNGLEHMETLRSRFGPEHVASGSIRIESERVRPGVIVQTSPTARVELAADDPRAAAALPRVARLLSDAGIPASLGRSERQVLWSKLVRLVALSATTAAFDQPLGVIRRDPVWRAALISSVNEAAAVAAADGAEVDPTATLAELDAAHSALRSSLQRDLAAGRPLELDAIQGAVLRAAARHGVSAPTIEALTATIAQRAGIPAYDWSRGEA